MVRSLYEGMLSGYRVSWLEVSVGSILDTFSCVLYWAFTAARTFHAVRGMFLAQELPPENWLSVSHSPTWASLTYVGSEN